jgi:hypothetical protein
VGSANAKPGCSGQNTVSTAHPTILKIFQKSFRIAIEDIALEKAIKEGENTESVSREAIFKILDRQG